jgi:FkbM family methyltransferase
MTRLGRRVREILAGSPIEAPARRLFERTQRDRRNATYDRQAAKVMARCLQADSVCIDVGCHTGSVLREMLRHAPRGHHHAFEPLPHLARRLAATYGRSVTVHEMALSDEAGIASFQHVVGRPAFSGFLLRGEVRGEQATQMNVHTARLDDVAASLPRVDLVKVDVEGAELRVLRGARETLARHRPVVIFEHGLTAAAMYGDTTNEIHALLTGCGLGVWLMESWLAGAPPLTRGEFCDVVLAGRDYYFLAARG